jgi:alpha-beta hydrolase superfamily lysophospholipase
MEIDRMESPGMLAIGRWLIVAVLSVLVAAPFAMADVVSITIDGAPQNVLLVAPATKPIAAVVMFPGGDGQLGIGANGSIARPGNFLIRTRDKWLARGFLFVAVDAAVGRVNTRGDRVGPANLRAIAEIVRTVRSRTSAPIWLLGTSAGAPAAVAGAASLPAGSIKGVVISSPVSISSMHDTVFDVALARITVPVLIQIHQQDGCNFTPPYNAARIKAALTAAPVVEVQQFSGGSFPRSGPCEPFAQHGFFGIEDQVVTAAANWIVAH